MQDLNYRDAVVHGLKSGEADGADIVSDLVRNKCHASSNRCLTSSNKKLLGTSATLVVTSASLLVTRN